MLKRKLFKWKRILIISILFTVFVLSILKIDSWSLEEVNISCHYVYTNSSLPVLGKNSYVSSRSIYFHVNSCPGNLTWRQSCAIESAAAAHPQWHVHVIFSGPVSDANLYNFTSLNKFNNIKYWRIFITEFTIGTVFEEIVQSDTLKNCKWINEINKDLLKYLMLFKWGGIHLDLDIVVARPLSFLARNCATRDHNNIVGDEILAFSRDSVGKNISATTIKEMQSILKSGDCSRVRPSIMTKILRDSCSTVDVTYMSSATCNGFEVYGPQFFHPIPENRARDYFKPGELEAQNVYTYHVWDHITKDYKVMRSSPYAKLARRYCPKTFNMYSERY